MENYMIESKQEIDYVNKKSASRIKNGITFFILVRRLVNALLTKGFVKTAQLIREWINDFLCDRRFGIQTCGYVTQSTLGCNEPFCMDYASLRYRNIYEMLNSIKITTKNDVFLDYGSGMGRVLIVAATYPFQKVIGVELSPELNIIAKENIQKSHSKLICKDIHLVTVDAALYLPQADVTHFFLFNPFIGNILSKVFDNIRSSLVDNPRNAIVLYVPPIGNPKTILDDISWLQKCRELSLFPRVHNRIVRIYINKR